MFRKFRKVKKIFELEASTGALLLIATIAALCVANSKSFVIYHEFFSLNLPLNLSFIGVQKDLTIHDWINDALMAIFFLLVGLELKKEICKGELSSKSKAMLPAIAACGGVIVPALIFYFCNFSNPENLRGFAIPTATDIAFAYGIICLFGNKISKSLKVFLVSLAIFDDLVAILIIALYYTQNLDPFCLTLAFLTVVILAILSLKKSDKVILYLIFGIILWLMILKSGIHPTIAGVILATFIPIQKDILDNLVKKISPLVNFLILPLFAFSNSGVRIENFSLEIFSDPLVFGIILGLFFGKQFGVMLFSFLAIKLGLTSLPQSFRRTSTWLEFYAVTILTGIGFTMSFFVGSLAFASHPLVFENVKIGVLCGSFLSAVFAVIMIYISLRASESSRAISLKKLFDF
ncbi:MAG: Na+/H+ antiporter NhaA [Proteobacteria bacterium]|nr:Na+/H+ antiporter NhaA [Pseudomonadota bacterium]